MMLMHTALTVGFLPGVRRVQAVRARVLPVPWLGLSLVLLVAIACTGCASLAPPLPLDKTTANPELLACADWYATLDAETDSAGVRDAGAVRVPGFAHLRVDRFTAALAGTLGSDGNRSETQAAQAALVQRLQQLDLQARSYEIANLPAQARMRLAHSPKTEATAPTSAAQSAAMLVERTQTCAARLAAHDTTSPARLAALLQRLNVPDDYITAYRIAGVYALSRYPFAAGVRKMEAQRLAVLATDGPPDTGSTRLRYAPPQPTTTASLTYAQISRMLAPAPADPLQVPAPSTPDLERLFTQFAPRFEIDTASNDDLPGTLVWRSGQSSNAPPSLALDTAAPALYRQVAYTRYQGRNLLQLVYTLWFAARPPAPGSTFDMLAGQLDGVVWRVTLAPDGTPLLYDSMHPCGCYHLFFPTPAALPKPAPETGIEWAFVPTALPAVGAQDRVTLRIAARTHYVDRVSVGPVAGVARIAGGTDTQSTTPYAWRDYHSLRSLPVGASSEKRSVFNPKGFIDGTDRPERWLFWPMGIERAGSMRQWGKHATAFVGRRHFDDATLLEQRFVFDPKHFGPAPSGLSSDMPGPSSDPR
jgi:hypothetical protein